MATGRPDPYATLGVPPTAADAEVRAAYRRLVQLHHPDHNSGSAESTRRFEEIQDAYAEIKRRRASGTGGPGAGQARPQARPTAPRPTRPRRPAPPRSTAPRTAPTRGDPAIEERLADLEQQVRVEREKARQAARDAARDAAREAAAAQTKRPTDEELGYVTTEDTIAKILSDARSQAADRLAEMTDPVGRRVADLLDDLAAKLNGGDPPRERR